MSPDAPHSHEDDSEDQPPSSSPSTLTPELHSNTDHGGEVVAPAPPPTLEVAPKAHPKDPNDLLQALGLERARAVVMPVVLKLIAQAEARMNPPATMGAPVLGNGNSEYLDADNPYDVKEEKRYSAETSNITLDDPEALVRGIIYVAEEDRFAVVRPDGTAYAPGSDAVKRLMKSAGYSFKTPDTSVISAGDLKLAEKQKGNYVDYLQNVAGHGLGRHMAPDGRTFLVERAPRIIRAVAGECPDLLELMTSFFDGGHEDLRFPIPVQHLVFMTCLGASMKALEQAVNAPLISGTPYRSVPIHPPCQAMFLIGPGGSAKTLVKNIYVALLGGREANPLSYFTTSTDFNKDLIGSECLVIDDEQPSHKYEERVRFATVIKNIVAAQSQRCHPKNVDAFTVRPFWRVMVCINDDPANLESMPIIDRSLSDKVHLFKAYPGKVRQYPGLSHAAAIDARWAELARELPAYKDLCLEAGKSLPEALADSRFPTTAYHHPAYHHLLARETRESGFMEILRESLLRRTMHRFDGSAREIEKLIRAEQQDNHEANQIFKHGNSCGILLRKLASSHPHHVQLLKLKDGIQQYRVLLSSLQDESESE